MYGIDIFNFVNKLKRKHRTSNPYEIAAINGISIKYIDLDLLKGMFTYIERCPFIFLNNSLDEQTEKIVLFHELGHYYLHRHNISGAFKEFSLCDFTSKYEIEANLFAASYLICDNDIEEYVSRGFTSEQTAKILEVPHELLLLKLNDMNMRGYELNVAYNPKSNFLA